LASFADSHPDSESDKKSPDPDSCQSEKSDLDPCEKLDPDADPEYCFEALT
jgi:hypothetical protein